MTKQILRIMSVDPGKTSVSETRTTSANLNAIICVVNRRSAT